MKRLVWEFYCDWCRRKFLYVQRGHLRSIDKGEVHFCSNECKEQQLVEEGKKLQ